jgi:hypothetical protein
MSELTKLAERKDAILLAEIGAWLHLLWKYDWRFIEKHCRVGTETKWSEEEYLSELAPGSPLADLLLADQPLLRNLGGDGTAATLANFLSRKGSHPLVKLLKDAHGRSSGVDKPWHITCNQQAFEHVALTTAFGCEQRIVCKGDYQPDRLVSELNQALSAAGDETWKALPGVRRALREHLTRVPAETRRPGNDITIYDQTAMAVAFFKAALARLVVCGEAGRRWRTLAVRVDAIEWLSGSSKVPDLLGRQGMISEAWDEAARIVEYEYPLGAEIYRDEAQIAFLVTDADVLGWSGGRPLRDILRAAVEEKTSGELSPDPVLTDVGGSGRWLFDFGKRIADPPPPNSSNIDMISSAWEKREGRERCSNCGLRPFGYGKAEKRQICDACLEKRVSRSETWWQNGRDRTVWLEEAADINGRLALITGTFDLSAWLNGTALTSISAVNAISHPKRSPCRAVSFADIERDAEDWKNGGPPGCCEPLLYDKVSEVPDRADYFATLRSEWAAYCDPKGPTSDSTRFAIAAANQRPSFARMRRVWETAKDFWDSLLPAKGVGSVLEKIGPSSYQRLRIVPDSRPDNAGPWHACVLRNAGVEIAAVWVPEDGGSLVTADNFDYLAREHGQACLNFPDGREIEVEEPAGYMRRGATSRRVKIRRTEPLGDFHPVIRLLATPATFMAIVPAQAAWRAVGAIRGAYELQMNKVRDRLPLHLGVVFAHRYTPLRAILGAGRRMLQYRRPAEQWTVAGGCTLTRNGRSALWKVEGSDRHFPYAYLADASHGTPVSHRAFRDALDPAEKVCDMARVSDLVIGDRIWYNPSTVDFEWLESSGVRFTLSYGKDAFRRGAPSRPWLLDDLPRLERLWERLADEGTGLKKRQIRGLAAVIEQRREEWRAAPGDSVFAAFCRSTLAEADWGRALSPAELDEFTRQAVSGMLSDVIDLHTRVLKEK